MFTKEQVAAAVNDLSVLKHPASTNVMRSHAAETLLHFLLQCEAILEHDTKEHTYICKCGLVWSMTTREAKEGCPECGSSLTCEED